MSHRDGVGRNGFGSSTQDLVRVINGLLSKTDFGSLPSPPDSRWSFRGLVIMALLWVWSDEATLTGRFAAVLGTACRVWSGEVVEAISYQAFLKRLVRWTERLLVPLKQSLQAQMRQSLATKWQIAGRCVFGVDGSKLELARTRSNEGRFAPAAARNGKITRSGRKTSRQSRESRRKKANSPQLWITLLWNAGTRLPWDWRLGAADSSERGHLLEMTRALPARSLITADAGFVGYAVWSALLAAGHDILIRVGGNVRLLKKLAYARESDGTVYLWPDQAARRNQAPLVLRLVVVQGARQPWYLVTSVRSSQALSDRQIAEIYRQRWGIEVFYRHFKQTFARRKLRSHAADHVLCEAHWSLVGFWGMLLYATQRINRSRTPVGRLSIAGVLRVFRRLLRQSEATAGRAACSLDDLNEALVDHYGRPSKKSRTYPRKKLEPPCTRPLILKATARQQRCARQSRT
jgi:Transposase DDE domain